ncbi:MAG: lycopene cyclase domain-containing protein [Terrimesophilobacter sp.]
MMPEYALLTVAGIAAVVAFEHFWGRTRVFVSRQYWLALGIVLTVQVLVDGWLTKLSAPIVTYGKTTFAGIRFPFDIPIEDFGFGFAMISLTIMMWILSGPSSGSDHNRRRDGTDEPGQR